MGDCVADSHVVANALMIGRTEYLGGRFRFHAPYRPGLILIVFKATEIAG